MKNSVKAALVFVIPLVLAFICFKQSSDVMNDCWRPETKTSFHPADMPDCDDDGILMTRDVFRFLGAALILGQAASVLIMYRRKGQIEQIEIDAIKISEL